MVTLHDMPKSPKLDKNSDNEALLANVTSESNNIIDSDTSNDCPTQNQVEDIILDMIKSTSKMHDTQDKSILLGKNLKDFGLDSLDITTLFMDIEDKFSLQILEEQIESFKIINDIATYVYNEVRKQGEHKKDASQIQDAAQ